MYVPQLSYPFVCRWTSRLLSCPGYCKQCFDEHFTSIFLSISFWPTVYKVLGWPKSSFGSSFGKHPHHTILPLSSVAWSCLTLCNPMDCNTPGFPITNSQSLLKLMSIQLVIHPTISSSVVPFSSWLQIFLSIRVFSNESVLHIRWPKYYSLSISPSNEYSVLISFRIDWFDLPVVQRTIKILQHHSSTALILQHSAFFTVQLSHP